MEQPVLDDRSPDALRKQIVRDEIALKKNKKNENRLKTYNQDIGLLLNLYLYFLYTQFRLINFILDHIINALLFA